MHSPSNINHKIKKNSFCKSFAQLFVNLSQHAWAVLVLNTKSSNLRNEATNTSSLRVKCNGSAMTDEITKRTQFLIETEGEARAVRILWENIKARFKDSISNPLEISIQFAYHSAYCRLC